MKKTLAQKAAEKGLTVETVKRRMKRNGWTEKKALNTPLQVNKSHPKLPKVEIPEDVSKPSKHEDYTDGFIIMISVTLLAIVASGLIWMLTK